MEIRAAMRDADKILNGDQALEAHEHDDNVRDKAFSHYKLHVLRACSALMSGSTR